MARRKTPFSGKAKKQQLQAKKLARKNGKPYFKNIFSESQIKFIFN